MIVSDDPFRTELIASKQRAGSAPCGPGSVATLALSAIDIAFWDIAAGCGFGLASA